MTTYFEDQLPGLKEAKESLSKINQRFALARLFSFLAAVGFIIAGFVRGKSILLFIAGGILVVVFAILCVIHDRSKYMEALLGEKINAAERYIARGVGAFDELGYDGKEFVNHTHPFTSDLDVFGPHSLFQLYNISHSVFGCKAFADKLRFKHFEKLNKKTVSDLQRDVKILEDDVEFLLDYESIGAHHKIDKMPDALLTLCSRDNVLSTPLKLLYKLLPLLWLVPVVLFFLNMGKYLRISCLAIVLINFVVWFLISKLDISDIFKAGMISKQANAIKVRVESLLSDENRREAFVPSYLSETFEDDIDSLMKACSMCSVREQPISALILNAVMPYDLWCADRLLGWSNKHGKNFMTDVENLGQIESLMCAAVPGIIAKIASTPVIREDKKAFFDGADMTHPLLNPAKAVSNNVDIDSKAALITGSNMSGKTTLIRTVGVMMILTYMGARVPASKVECSIMRIMTSMRIADSLEENMSTFKAELIRIGSIVEASKDETPLMFLIDEVFRGTNSQDRTDGAEILLKNLTKPHIAGFMTTHDYALCDRAAERKDDNIVFFHFSERYEEEEVIFDYKLRSGLSHESNAMFLMRLVGIK